MEKSRLVLGTAQFGMDYGINNKRGKIPKKEAFKILQEAIDSGIDSIDTASAYGESEAILGDFIKEFTGEIKIVSKLLPDCGHRQVNEAVKSSLGKLNVHTLYSCLIHSFEDYKKDRRIWEELEKLKSDGKIKKIGFSLYFPLELESVLGDNLKIDMIQVPFSIFDQRFSPYLSELKKRKVEIYTRSVFLQGLVFKKPDGLDNYFERIRDKIRRLNLLSKELEVPISALCINFVLFNEFIDRVVVGVDTLENLREIICAVNYSAKVKSIIHRLSGLREDNEKIILPFNWDFVKANAR